MRSEALDTILEKYYYALGNTEKRFILSGCYDGLGRDYPDVLTLAAIIIITAISFLNEENANVSTLIRTSENGRKSAFKAKIFALIIFFCACQLLQMICELSVMIFRGESKELLFPVQSIPFLELSIQSNDNAKFSRYFRNEIIGIFFCGESSYAACC